MGGRKDGRAGYASPVFFGVFSTTGSGIGSHSCVRSGSVMGLADELGLPALVISATAHLFKLAEGLLGKEGDDPLVVKAVEIIGRHGLERRE